MLLHIEYRPTKYASVIPQYFRIIVYPEHHTLNNNFVNYLGVNPEDAEQHIANMQLRRGNIIVEPLKGDIEHVGWAGLRGRSADPDPIVIRGKALPYFYLKFNQSNKILSFETVQNPPVYQRILTRAEKETLMNWFGLTIKSFLTDEVVEKLHDDELNRYVEESVGRISRAVDDLLDLQETIRKASTKPLTPALCPQCGEELHLVRNREARIDPSTYIIEHGSIDNTIQCTACDWTDDGNGYLDVIDHNLTLKKLV